MKKVAFHTLGCKVNQYETEVLRQTFLGNGFSAASCDTEAEIHIINSCTVTATGDKKVRQLLRRLRRLCPDGVIGLTGCFPQAYPDAAVALPEADVITGSANRGELFAGVVEFLATGKRIVRVGQFTADTPFEPMSLTAFSERTRASIKIQDGCNCRCSYCIIPTARGPVRSKPPEDILKEAEALAANGYTELVPVGINLSFYGSDLGLTLAEGISAVCKPEGVRRVRLGSLEPELLTEERIAALAGFEKLCPQFHLSLQSGSDRVLAAMRRRYRAEQYLKILGDLRRAFPDCAITTDIIAGFPGETEEDHAQTLSFIEAAGFAKVHVFPYSKRPGTDAASLPHQVSPQVKARRAAELSQRAAIVRNRFMEGMVGKEFPVLFEQCRDNLWQGYTPNYSPVALSSEEDLSGQCRIVRITGWVPGQDHCTGKLV